MKRVNKKQLVLCSIPLLQSPLSFLFFLTCRLMMKKCMAANISGLFQGGMKIFGGNPGLIPHSVSVKIFLQPWKVILEWILSLSAQKLIRLYQEGLVFFFDPFYYTIMFPHCWVGTVKHQRGRWRALQPSDLAASQSVLPLSTSLQF